MGSYLKMTDKQRIQALLELGWSHQRIERETGIRPGPQGTTRRVANSRAESFSKILRQAD